MRCGARSRRAAWPCTPIASGREFLDAYQPTPNACLLLDMKMPGM